MKSLVFNVNIGLFAEEDPGREGMAVSSVVGNATASKGLEVAVANLQEYCNGMVLFILTDLLVDNKSKEEPYTMFFIGKIIGNCFLKVRLGKM